MDMHQIGHSTLEVLSETSKSVFLRSSDGPPLPQSLYFDSLIILSDLPQSTSQRVLCSLLHQATEGTKIIESAYQNNEALKCFEASGENVFFIFYCSQPTLTSFVLARFSFFELCLEPDTFYKELARLAMDRVKDIRFKNSLKESFGYYKSYFDQWVETVSTQQREINALSEELLKFKEVDGKSNEKEESSTIKCILCDKEQRNVVFVPCGHVVVCTFCLVENLKLKPNTLPKNPQKCISCKKIIKIAHEVYF